ncbi:MAG TPA: hypothetical protein VJX74_15115 [Blastocatellia bacterium]|nr:hypothetical protein [Blastocatellia bacterium]
MMYFDLSALFNIEYVAFDVHQATISAVVLDGRREARPLPLIAVSCVIYLAAIERGR